MISLVNFAAALLILALLPPMTARITRLVTRDSIAEPLRTWVRRKSGEHSMWAELIGCHWCVGIWASLVANSWAWGLIISVRLFPTWLCIGIGLMSIPAVAYLASRMIDREDG